MGYFGKPLRNGLSVGVRSVASLKVGTGGSAPPAATLRQVQIPGYQFIDQTSLTTSAQVPGGPYVSQGK